VSLEDSKIKTECTDVNVMLSRITG